MARYILIDNNSGYIWADSADFEVDGRIRYDWTPVEFAQAVDASLGATDRAYSEIGHKPRDTSTGYHVYRADVRGSEAVQVVRDGQDHKAIEAVERDCDWVTFIRVERQDADAL